MQHPDRKKNYFLLKPTEFVRKKTYQKLTNLKFEAKKNPIR